MRVLGYIQDSTADGEGLRDVLFCSGCTHGCIGCHNQESWDATKGIEFTKSMEDKLLKNLKRLSSPALTLSGGDPLHPNNYRDVLNLCKRFKEEGVNIWLYTGYTLEELYGYNISEILMFIDVLVDGKFELNLKSHFSIYRGSSNQRIIRLKNGKVVSKEDN